MGRNGFMRYRYPAVLNKEWDVEKFMEKMGATLVLDTCSTQVIPPRKLLGYMRLGFGMHTVKRVLEEKGAWETKSPEDEQVKSDFGDLISEIEGRWCIEERKPGIDREREIFKGLLPEISKSRALAYMESGNKELYRTIFNAIDILSRAFFSQEPIRDRELYVHQSSIIVREMLAQEDWKRGLSQKNLDMIEKMKGTQREELEGVRPWGILEDYQGACSSCSESLRGSLMSMGVSEQDADIFIAKFGKYWNEGMRSNIATAMMMYTENVCDDVRRAVSGRKRGNGHQSAISPIRKYLSNFSCDLDVMSVAHYLAPYRPYVGIVSEDSDLVQLNVVRNCLRESVGL